MSGTGLGSPLATTAAQALLRPVREGNAFEETIERVLSMIKLGVVGVGDRLPPERELAQRLAVARVTVREAIRALQEAGVVESRRGRYGGTFVCSEPRGRRSADARWRSQGLEDDLEDALAVRTVVETGAAERAATRGLEPGDVRHLEQLVGQTAAAPLTEYRRADSRLHLAIAELTGSTSVTAVVADARMRINAALDAIPLIELNIAHSNEQHAVIVQAVLDGRPTKARRAMGEHVEGTASLLRGFLAT